MHPGLVAAADWSGARVGEHRGLWLAEWDGSRGQVVGVEPLSRAAATARLLELARRDPRLVVGLDFAFSLPKWWLDANGIDAAGDLWGDRARLEAWLQRCEPPFWGRPGRRRPVFDGPEWRPTELAAPLRPRSVFQVGGAGSVGTASLRGMPTLAALRAGGMAVWPFDDWALPAVVEVWPRLALGRLVKSSRDQRRSWVVGHAGHLAAGPAAAAEASADALDAVAAALDLAGRGTAPRPAALDDRRLEGWIDGV